MHYARRQPFTYNGRIYTAAARAADALYIYTYLRRDDFNDFISTGGDVFAVRVPRDRQLNDIISPAGRFAARARARYTYINGDTRRVIVPRRSRPTRHKQ